MTTDPRPEWFCRSLFGVKCSPIENDGRDHDKCGLLLEGDVTEQRTKWQHRLGDRYVVIFANVVTVGDDFEIVYRKPHPGGFPTLELAIGEGFEYDRSDDFNIGVIRAGRLAAKLWMDEVIEEPQKTLDEILEAIHD